MFKKEINFISDLNLNKIQILGDRFTIEEINKSKIHPAIIQFINAAIDLEIFFDRKKIEKDSVFQYSGDRINNYFGLISEEIKRTQYFDFNHIKLIMQNAIIFNTNYLIRPNKTLANFVFGEFEIKPIEEIVIKISHVYYYRYLQKILLTYLDKKKILQMKREEFVILLNRIDLVSKETHLDDTLSTAISSIANFFDQSSKSPDKLPLQAINFYLEEKGLIEFATKLEKKFGDDSTAFYLATDIHNLIKSVTPEAEIIIEDSVQIEDELVCDNSEQDVINEEVESEIEVPELDTISDEINTISSNEIFEVIVDDVEIPNHDILSSDEIIDQEDQKTSDNVEPMKMDENTEPTEKDKDEEKDSNNIEDQGENVKKKPKTKPLIRELINLGPLYDSLLPPLKPFENGQEKFSYANLQESLSDEINYQIDISTLKEEIEIKKEFAQEVDHSDYLPKNFSEEEDLKNKIIEDKSFSEETVLENNNEVLQDSAEAVEDEYLDIGETIENVVNSEINEFEATTESEATLNIDKDGQPDLESLIDNTKLSLIEEDDDELTEVFTDLTFLDQKNEIIKPNFEDSTLDVLPENSICEQDNNELGFDNDPNNFSNFSGMLASRDVTKIIEIIFDYDMEDYYSLINKISESNSENSAIQFTDEYCQNNHVDISSNEVEKFKSLISEYFTRALS